MTTTVLCNLLSLAPWKPPNGLTRLPTSAAAANVKKSLRDCIPVVPFLCQCTGLGNLTAFALPVACLRIEVTHICEVWHDSGGLEMKPLPSCTFPVTHLPNQLKSE